MESPSKKPVSKPPAKLNKLTGDGTTRDPKRALRKPVLEKSGRMAYSVDGPLTSALGESGTRITGVIAPCNLQLALRTPSTDTRHVAQRKDRTEGNSGCCTRAW